MIVDFWGPINHYASYIYLFIAIIVSSSIIIIYKIQTRTKILSDTTQQNV